MTEALTLRDAFGPTGLRIADPDLTYDDWFSLGQAIGGMQRATPWMVGDWYVYGEARFGVTAEGVSEEVGIGKQAVLNYGSVARKIPPQDRRPELSWFSHSLVAALPRAERNRILKQAVKEGWDSTRIRGVLAAGKAQKVVEEQPEPLSAKDALALVARDPVWKEIATAAINAEVVCPHCGGLFTP